jgi:hypothetical protein
VTLADASMRRVLRHMKKEFSSSDPSMVLLFVNFTQLTHGQGLPRTERLQATRAGRWPWRRGAQPPMAFFFTLFMVTLVACWAFAIVITGGAHGNGPATPKQHFPAANSNCANLHGLERYLAQLGSKPASTSPC